MRSATPDSANSCTRGALRPRSSSPTRDNELYLNLDDESCRSLLLEEIGRRRQIVLEEFVFAGDAGVVRCGDDTYTNEAIFAFHKNR